MEPVTHALGQYERREWPANPSGPSRRHRRAGSYDVFIPAPIATRAFALDDDAVASIARATRALAELNSAPPRLASLEALARNLLRSEAAASSRIEGLVLSHQRLGRAAYQPAGRPGGDRRAAEVLSNVEVMEKAIALGSEARPLAVADITEMHRTLLRFAFDAKLAGVIRDRQNWIGGSDYHPIDAAYVPPPPEHVATLLDDLCGFIARDDIAPLAQAAIAHAQFETIHPFADGNGRVGRALIYTVLRRRGETTRYIPPISLALGAAPRAYVSGLVDYREGRISEWCGLFASATERAARDAGALADRIDAVQAQWLSELGEPRRDAAVRQIIAALPAQPVLDVAAARQLTGKSHVATGKALNQLEAAGILQRLNEKKWGRVWECGALLDLVGEFEERATSREP
jgi:Fic family protein